MATHTLHDCYRAIVKAAGTAPQGATIRYAAVYAITGLRMPDAASSGELLSYFTKAQALYVRINLVGWRGDEAKAVRLAMDKILGVKK